MLSRFLAIATTVAAGAVPLMAQSTQAHWSTYFGGGSGSDIAMVVKRGPGSLLTIAGHSAANGLATAGAYQTTIAGGVDAFVARFDTSLPRAQQKLWCTYFGGAAMELVFDAEVDAAGEVTIVGLTFSDPATFPIVNGFQVSRMGPTDGFVARFDAQGANLLYSTYLGGNGDDRICALEMDASGNLVVAGVTEAAGLPPTATAGTVGPTYMGGTDAFAARIEPSLSAANQLRWATYIGGPFNEGPPFASWLGWDMQWEGVLDTIGLVVEPSGSVVVATACQSPTAPTTPGCLQSVHGGGAGVANVYLARLSSQATSLQYATFFGGAGNNPRDMVAHPAGGFVIVGHAVATNLPTTPQCYQPAHMGGPHGGLAEGYLCRIDPAQPVGQHLRYSTYFGGDGGEDGVLCAKVESSGIVTIGGYLSGGFTPRSTPGCLQPTGNPFEYTGIIARLALNGNGKADLLYASYLGNAWTVMQDIALDDVGDAVIVGASGGASYPTTLNAYQPAHSGPGLRDAVITHMPLMSGGTTRFDLAFVTPACAQPLYHGAFGPPMAGNAGFAFTATNAPPVSLGLMLFDLSPRIGPPITVPGINIPLIVVPLVIGGVVASDALGYAQQPLPIPAVLAPGFQVYSQWAFLTNAACPGTGMFASSEGLVMTTL